MVRERRRKRSSFTGLALQYWLSAIAQKERLFAMVLADSAGLLVAANIPGPEAEELAAIAPLLAKPLENGGKPVVCEKVPMIVLPMQVESTTLYLCTVGNQQRSMEGLRVAENGVRRILHVH